MKGLNCEVKALKHKNYELTPPLYRQDLKRPVDFVEEYARMKGYDVIPETLPSMVKPPQEMTSSFFDPKRS